MTETSTSTSRPADPRPWYQRHKMRALGVIFLVWVVFCSTVFAAVAAYFINQTRQSEPFRLALDTLRAAPQVQQALGTPIEAAWFTLGSVDADRGYAEFNMRLTGSQAKAGVRVIAEKPPDKTTWELVFLDVGVKDGYGGRIITLINDQPPVGPTLPEPTDEAKQKYGVQ